MNVEDFTKEELLNQTVKQFSITSSVIDMLRTLTNDGATGSQRAGVRILAREFIKDYDRAMDDAKQNGDM